MLNRESARRIAGLARRARAIAFLDGAADATLVAGLVAGSLLLALRLLGWPAEPSVAATVAWSLLGVVILAALVGGTLTMRRRTPRAAGCAAWLDRRLSLGGLLVTSVETDAAGWDGTLQRTLAAAESELPQLPVRRTAQRVALPLAFVAAIALLPAARPEAPLANPALADALAVEQARLDLLEQRAALDPRTAEELQSRLDELAQRLDELKPVGWSDLDALAARGEAALALRVDALRQADEALGAMAAAGQQDLAGELGEALRKLEAAGLLGDLPPELLERLGQAAGRAAGQGLDPSALAALDRKSLEGLARDLQSALGQRFDSLVEAGLADPLKGRQLAARSAAERKAARPGHKHGSQCAGGQCSGDGVGSMLAAGAAGTAGNRPGSGGITRGRGDAELRYTGETEASAEAFQAEQLPSTAPLSNEWTTIGVGLAEPEVDPVETHAAGGAAQTGAGSATWGRRLAPHHRDVVKRFFERPR